MKIYNLKLNSYKRKLKRVVNNNYLIQLNKSKIMLQIRVNSMEILFNKRIKMKHKLKFKARRVFIHK
jgi:hypothetical protein